MKSLPADELAALLGVESASVSACISSTSFEKDLGYADLQPKERDAVILRILRVLAEDDLAVAGPDRRTRWEEGWGENLDELKRSGFRPELLEPRYFHHDVARLRGDYVLPLSERFEYSLFSILRTALFREHLAGCAAVVELGCGTGANLLLIGELFPEAELLGYDWARSSQEILAVAARETGARVSGRHIDMFEPPAGGALLPQPNSAVLTVHAFEQLGSRFGPMLEALLAARPRICVQIEPIVELYDEDRLPDQLAIRYHRARGYLEGYLPALRDLEREGRVEIIDARRSSFGSLFHEGYSIVIWKPR